MTNLLHLSQAMLPAALQISIILIACLMLLALIRRGFGALTQKVHKKHVAIFERLASVLRLIVLLAGVIMCLSATGVDVTALVTGLGLSGFALSFAFKDILSNVLSGFLLMFYHPFKTGQTIKVDSFTGKVSSIDLRYVTLKNDDNEVILVPNTLVLTKVVTITSKS